MGRAVLLWMIPANLVLLAWVWFGRIVFGVGGWFLLILAPVVLLGAIGLTVTTVLAYTQAGRPRSLTRPQAVAQLLAWLGMAGFGLFLPDFGDTEESVSSFLTVVFGRSDRLVDVGMGIAGSFGVLAVVGYAVLLVLLIGARRGPASG